MKHIALLTATLALTPYFSASLSAADKPAPQGATPNKGNEIRSVRKPIAFEEYTLPNGLHVILHENHAAPVITSYVLYHVGSKNERPDRTGFAHFFEHLMFEGSENIPRSTIDKYISSAGGNLNASTSFDRTDYYFNLPSNQLKLALWIESERMLHPKIDDTGVETQRSVVKEERRRSYDNRPYGSLFEELSSLVFEGTPYQWVPIGSFQYIDKATIEEFRDFHRTFYRPDNATIVLAGDFVSAEAKKLIEDYFGSIPKGPGTPQPDINWEIAVKGKSKDILKKNTPLPGLVHAWRGPTETHEDAYPLEMLTNILGKGRSSRLYQRLVEKEGVAMNATPYCFLMEKAGLLALSVTAQAGSTLEDLDRLLKSEIQNVIDKGVTEEEFEKARNTMESMYADSASTMHERAKSLAHYSMFYKNTGLINTELDRYLAVKREDLQRVAKKYFTDEGRFTLRFVLPESK